MSLDPKSHRLYTLLQQLDEAGIHYTLARVRDDTVMILATVPGRRYEIEVFSDGTLEVEVFGGTGNIKGQEAVDELLENYSDAPDSTA
jgi:hypothetical protein